MIRQATWILLALSIAGCPRGLTGPAGQSGTLGAPGTPGPAGANGAQGVNGVDGTDGADGTDGKDGQLVVLAGSGEIVPEPELELVECDEYKRRTLNREMDGSGVNDGYQQRFTAYYAKYDIAHYEGAYYLTCYEYERDPSSCDSHGDPPGCVFEQTSTNLGIWSGSCTRYPGMYDLNTGQLIIPCHATTETRYRQTGKTEWEPWETTTTGPSEIYLVRP